MKRKLLLVLMAVCVLAAALMGSTVAAVDETSAALLNNVTTPYVNVTVQSREGNETVTAKSLPDKIGAGQTVKLDYVAVNNNIDGTKEDASGKTTNSGVTEYVIVTLTKYWTEPSSSSGSDSDSSKPAVVTGVDNSLIQWSLTSNNDWIVLNQSDNQVVLLYTKPVASGEATSVALESVTMPKDVTALKGLSIAVDATAESVQYIKADGTQETADANADAIATAYGVPVTVDKTTGAVSMSSSLTVNG